MNAHTHRSSSDRFFAMERSHLLAVAAALAVKRNEATKKKRTKWTKEWLLKRNILGHINLLNDLRIEGIDWFNYLRMDEDTYFRLLELVTPFIKRKNTHMRPSINPHERLTATLRFLATGRNYEDMKFSTLISAQSLGRIIPETCEAIYRVLKPEYLKFPKTEEEWRVIGKKFEIRWNFPNCLGAVDGKHINIIPPPNSGSFYWNYKGRHSLVLIAIVNAEYEFIMVHFGTNGRISDAGVTENTTFYNKLKNQALKIPPPCKPEDSEQELPFVFVGDEIFTLREDFLKPFSQQQLNAQRRIFNYRLSRCRRIVENVFAILASRFRIFHTAINMKLENTERVVMACCALHNFLRRNGGNNYIPQITSDAKNLEPDESEVGLTAGEDPLTNLQPGRNRNPTVDAKQVRELFTRYFCNEGAVPWQNNFI